VLLSALIVQTVWRLALAYWVSLNTASHAPCNSTPPTLEFFSVTFAAHAQGAEVGIGLLGDFGTVVCKFTAAELRPIMAKLLDILNQQNEETLGNLPAFTDALTRLDPGAFEVR
jgi:hypothetical protein